MEHGKPYALLNKVSNREGGNGADGKEEAKSKCTTVMVVIGVFMLHPKGSRLAEGKSRHEEKQINE